VITAGGFAEDLCSLEPLLMVRSCDGSLRPKPGARCCHRRPPVRPPTNGWAASVSQQLGTGSN